MSEPKKVNKFTEAILGENAKKIGTFKESTGGGTPLAKGEKLKDHPEADRVQQPRDEEGKFTYNSVNGKELRYGPSRGTTVPPILKGVKFTYVEKGTKLKLEGEDGSISILISTIEMTSDELVNRIKYWIEKEGGFAGLDENSYVVKKGRKSKAEKEAEPGLAGYVDPKTLSESTQKEIEDKASKAKDAPYGVNPTVGGFHVVTDTLNPDGSVTRNAELRYHEWLKLKNVITPSLPRDIVDKYSPKNKKFQFDYDLAKNNPDAFYNRNRELVDAIVTAFNDAREDKESEEFTKEAIIDAIANKYINESIFEEEPEKEKVPVGPDGKEIKDDDEKKAMKLFGVK